MACNQDSAQTPQGAAAASCIRQERLLRRVTLTESELRATPPAGALQVGEDKRLDFAKYRDLVPRLNQSRKWGRMGYPACGKPTASKSSSPTIQPSWPSILTWSQTLPGLDTPKLMSSWSTLQETEACASR